MVSQWVHIFCKNYQITIIFYINYDKVQSPLLK